MMILEVEGNTPLKPDQSQARTLDQQQKQIRLRKKNLALGKARDREHKLAAQITSHASKTALEQHTVLGIGLPATFALGRFKTAPEPFVCSAFQISLLD